MRQQPIIDRLDGLGLVSRGGALEWAGLTQAPGRLPAAYVVATGERASANSLDAGIDQRVEVDFDVMLVLNAAARDAGKISEQLDEFATAIAGRLTGWQHPDASRPTAYAGGGLVAIEAGTLAWRLGFRTALHLRKTDHG